MEGRRMTKRTLKDLTYLKNLCIIRTIQLYMKNKNRKKQLKPKATSRNCWMRGCFQQIITSKRDNITMNRCGPKQRKWRLGNRELRSKYSLDSFPSLLPQNTVNSPFLDQRRAHSWQLDLYELNVSTPDKPCLWRFARRSRIGHGLGRSLEERVCEGTQAANHRWLIRIPKRNISFKKLNLAGKSATLNKSNQKAR